jgi:pyruvate formate lyase activating enzyme
MKSASGKRIIGKLYSAEYLANILNRLVPILCANAGGITFSGGEPLAQAFFVADVISRLHEVHVLLDTSGYAPQDSFRLVVEKCDLVYYDLKLMNPAMHLLHTGVDNSQILNNLRLLSTMNIPYVIRVPLIPGLTDTYENLAAIAQIAQHLTGLVRVDLLPYNQAAGGKYPALGKKFGPTYDETQPVHADLRIFESAGVQVRIAGSMTRNSRIPGLPEALAACGASS